MLYSGAKGTMTPNPLQGLPLNGKKLTDSLAFEETPAAVYLASVVGSVVVRADMAPARPLAAGPTLISNTLEGTPWHMTKALPKG